MSCPVVLDSPVTTVQLGHVSDWTAGAGATTFNVLKICHVCEDAAELQLQRLS